MSGQKTVSESYDSGARGYRDTWKEPHPWLSEARDAFEKNVVAGEKALEIGFGAGHDLKYLSHLGLEVEGIDISHEMVELFRNSNKEIPVIEGDFMQTSYEDYKFGVVWASYSLLHLKPSRLPAALGKIAKMLHENGLLFIAMSIAETTDWRYTPVAGLKDLDGKAIPVWIARWNSQEFVGQLEKHFVNLWDTFDSNGLPNRDLYAGIWKKR